MPTPPPAVQLSIAEDGASLHKAAPSEVAEYIEDMLEGLSRLAHRSQLDRLNELLEMARAEARRCAAN